MIVAVSGWRSWADSPFIDRRLDRLLDDVGPVGLFVRVGDAPGADLSARAWLRRNVIRHTIYYADWKGLGNGAGPVRNGQMLRGAKESDPFHGQLADRLLAFPEPGVRLRSPGSGTAGCIFDALDLRIDVEIPGYRRGR